MGQHGVPPPSCHPSGLGSVRLPRFLQAYVSEAIPEPTWTSVGGGGWVRWWRCCGLVGCLGADQTEVGRRVWAEVGRLLCGWTVFTLE